MIFLLSLAMFCIHDADPEPPLPPPLAKLVVDLGDDEFKVRERASKELEKLDSKALPAYYKAIKSEDAEVSRRGKRLLDIYYNVQNTKGEISRIQGLYEMKDFKTKSGKVFKVTDDMANNYYTKAGGKFDDDNASNPDNFTTQDATRILIKELRNRKWTREDVKELLDKIDENAAGSNMGDEGHRRFREMQGLPQYEPGSLGVNGLFFRGIIGMRGGFGRIIPIFPPPFPVIE